MDPDYDAQMREWAERNGVTPKQFRAVSRDGGQTWETPLQWRDYAQREFYAGWDAYDLAPKTRWDLIAEIHALESWWSL